MDSGWQDLYKTLVCAVSHATEALSSAVNNPNLDADMERLALAFEVLANFVRDFPALSRRKFDPANANRIRAKIQEQIQLIDAIIEKGEAL